MENFLAYFLFAVGLLFIIKGGDFFVDAASRFAEILGVPKFLVGATVVSIATTLPELLTSVIATMDGSLEIAAGNAIGSVTANTGLIMGISIVFLPAIVKRSSIALKSILMALAAGLLLVFSLDGSLELIPSIIMIALFAIYTTDSIIDAKKSMADGNEQKEKADKKEILINLAKFVVGTIGIVVGADFLVDNGTKIAELLGVPDGIIAVTLVAIGTSLPELVTTITALVKKQSSLSVGNIIGANVIDLTLILPICSFISGGSLTVDAYSAKLDLPVCLGIILIAIVPTLIRGKFSRFQGVAMLLCYAAYLVVRCGGFVALG